MMRNALTARIASGASGANLAEDHMLLSGLTTLGGRAVAGSDRVRSIRQDFIALAAEIAAAYPHALDGKRDELEALSSPAIAGGMDPTLYFQRALAFFCAAIGDLGAPGQVSPDHLPLLAKLAEWEKRLLLDQDKLEDVGEIEAEPPLSENLVKEFIASELGGGHDISLTLFEEISGGMSKQAYRVSARSELLGLQEMVIKRSGGSAAVAIDCMPVHREFAVLKAVSALGMPSPKPLWLARELPGAGGDFFIMEKSRGSCTTSFLTTEAPVPRNVMLQIAEQMARLHSVRLEELGEFVRDCESFSPQSATAAEMVAVRLEAWRQLWLGFDRLPSPVEEYLFSWLKANIPPNSSPPSLVHGDFTPHNCLWEGDRLTAILDWEGAHFGDPAEDLAYAKPHIERRMDWSEFVGHYEAHGGPRVSARTIEYHSCYSNFRSLLLANVYVANISPTSGDLRALIVDNAFSGMFVDLCMSAAQNFERMRDSGNG
jgi:aminoglycoside phosphotransferase (APT) family kinase protein